MALDKDRWGQNVADAIAALGVVAGTPVTPTQLADMWKAIKGEDKTEVNANADIVLLSADIPVLPGTFSNAGGPVVGAGLNGPATLVSKIK